MKTTSSHHGFSRGFSSRFTSDSCFPTVGSSRWFSIISNSLSFTLILTVSPSRTVPLNSFLARGNNTSVRTTLAMALAPYSSEYPWLASHSRDGWSMSRTIRRWWSRSATSFRRRSTTLRMEDLESLLKTRMESSRFRSSGGKYSCVLSITSAFAWEVTRPVSRSDAVGWARMSLPRLLVKQMIVFLKSS